MYVHIHVHEFAFGCGCVYRAGRYAEFDVGVSVVAYVHTESHVGVRVFMYSRIYTQKLHTCGCIY